jgi:hypothetical protein
MSLHNYNAILIDTSIFDGNGLRLETGLLGKLRLRYLSISFSTFLLTFLSFFLDAFMSFAKLKSK